MSTKKLQIVGANLKGKDGYTPVKGVDYWTEEDKKEITDYVDKEIAEFDFVKVVDTLPETGLVNREYFVRKANPDTNDLFDEYAWINTGTEEEPNWGWEFKGTKKLEIELAEYVKFTDFPDPKTFKAGVVKIDNYYGIQVGQAGSAGAIIPMWASNENIDSKTLNRFLSSHNIDYATMSALANCKDTSIWTDDTTDENGEVVKGTKTKARELLGAVGTVTGSKKLYGTDPNGNQVAVNYHNGMGGSYVVQRDTDGSIQLPDINSQSNDIHAVNYGSMKSYVSKLPDNLELTEDTTAEDGTVTEGTKTKWQNWLGISSSGGLTEEQLAQLQTKTDENLETTDKTIVGAINEVRDKANEAEKVVVPYETLSEAFKNDIAGFAELSCTLIAQYGTDYFSFYDGDEDNGYSLNIESISFTPDNENAVVVWVLNYNKAGVNYKRYITASATEENPDGIITVRDEVVGGEGITEICIDDFTSMAVADFTALSEKILAGKVRVYEAEPFGDDGLEIRGYFETSQILALYRADVGTFVAVWELRSSDDTVVTLSVLDSESGMVEVSITTGQEG